MESFRPENFEAIANDMGISLHQRFSVNEASLFLRCPEADVKTLFRSGKLNGIKMTTNNFQFFGYQLLEYILGQSTDHKAMSSSPIMSNSPNGGVDRIIRAKEVQDLTGLSRTTLWRFENKGEFPRRVSLGASNVGWKLSEVQRWISERQ